MDDEEPMDGKFESMKTLTYQLNDLQSQIEQWKDIDIRSTVWRRDEDTVIGVEQYLQKRAVEKIDELKGTFCEVLEVYQKSFFS